MPWHDIAVKFQGEPVKDLSRHFIQYWNFAKIDLIRGNLEFLNFNEEKVSNKNEGLGNIQMQNSMFFSVKKGLINLSQKIAKKIHLPINSHNLENEKKFIAKRKVALYLNKCQENLESESVKIETEIFKEDIHKMFSNFENESKILNSFESFASFSSIPEEKKKIEIYDINEKKDINIKGNNKKKKKILEAHNFPCKKRNSENLDVNFNQNGKKYNKYIKFKIKNLKLYTKL